MTAARKLRGDSGEEGEEDETKGREAGAWSAVWGTGEGKEELA